MSMNSLPPEAVVTEVETDELPDPTVPTHRRRTGRMRLYVRRFFRNIPAVVGLGIFALLVLASLFGGKLTHWTYLDLDQKNLSKPPGGDHIFGTTLSGGDLYAQVMHGLGRSLTIAVTVAFASTLIAAFVGAFAAYLGGRSEKLILGVIHFLLIVPSFLLLALIANRTGGSWQVLIFVLILFGWMYPARVIWSLSMSIREREYIAAAQYMGVRGPVIVWRHMVPNIGSLLIMQFTLGIVSTVMTETGLSFLNFGVKIPDVSLGTLLQDGVSAVTNKQWLFAYPAGCLTLLTVSVALIADGLRDALDPNSAAGGRA